MKGFGYGMKLMIFAAVSGMVLLAVAAYAGGMDFLGGYPRLSDKNVLMQWSPVPGATEYRVYRSDSGAKPKVVGTPKVNKFIDKDVPSGKTLRYSVAAVSGGKETAKTSEATIATAKEQKKVFIPLKTPKLVGLHLKEAPGSKYSIGIRWENAMGTDMVGVNVYRSKAKGKDFALIGSSSTDTFEDKDVQPGTTYYYVVTTVDSQFNETKYSNELSQAIPSPAQVKAEEKVEEQKIQPTKMRPAKLLFRIPKEKDAPNRDANPYMPMDVAVDEAVGHIYVTSQIYGGVLVYNMDGDYQFGFRKDGVDGQQKFDTAMGVAVGQNGNVYVTDYAKPTISIFDFSGKPVGTIEVDNGTRMRARNHKISVAGDGTFYVSDPAINSVHLYDANNRHIEDWIGAKSEEEKKRLRAKLLINGPAYSAVLKNGDLVLVDSGTARCEVLDKNSGKLKNYIGKYGQAAGEFYYPSGVAVDANDNVFVGMGQSPNIQVFSPDGKFEYALCNETKNGPIPIQASNGIAIDSKNRLYVTEGFAGRVSVFQLMEGTVEILPPAKK